MLKADGMKPLARIIRTPAFFGNISNMFLSVWGSSKVKPCVKAMPSWGSAVLVTGKGKPTISHVTLSIHISFHLFSRNSSSYKAIQSFLYSDTDVRPKH